MAFREPKKIFGPSGKKPHAYGVSKKINKREKQAQSYFNNISSRSLSGKCHFGPILLIMFHGARKKTFDLGKKLKV